MTAGNGAAGFEVPEEVVIEADVKDFELLTTVTVISNDLLNDLDLDGVNGLDDLKAAMEKLTGASSQLKDGTDRLADGTSQLKDGSSRLAEGIGQADDGAGALADGAAELKDGLEQLDEAAIQKLVDLIDGDFRTLSDRTEAMLDLMNDYPSYGGRSEEMSGVTAFVIHTEAVEAAEESVADR
jgi:X-X-X-Leu-X-X-Gly heptad repeat protein